MFLCLEGSTGLGRVELGVAELGVVEEWAELLERVLHEVTGVRQVLEENLGHVTNTHILDRVWHGDGSGPRHRLILISH